MKKTAQDFGSHWNRPSSRVRTEESAETTCDSKDDYLGFRLVHDDSNQVRRGGGWLYDPPFARVALCSSLGPAGHFGSIGFRLARDEGET